MLDFVLKTIPEFSQTFLAILNDREIAALRRLNKTTLNALTDYFSKLAVPYRSVFHLFLVNHDFFIDQLHEMIAKMIMHIEDLETEGFPSDRINNETIPYHYGRIENLVQASWHQYHRTTLENTSIFPALIYKLRERSSKKITDSDMAHFAQGENVIATGRLYSTAVHTWVENLSWLLALIHKKRSFIIFSALNDKNLYRTNNPDEPSAFAREIGSIMKAGYQVGIHRDMLNKIVLFPNYNKEYLLTLNQLNAATIQELDDGIEKVIVQAHKIVKQLNMSDSYACTLYSLNNISTDTLNKSYGESNSDNDDTVCVGTTAVHSRPLFNDQNLDDESMSYDSSPYASDNDSYTLQN